jgi:hypothetical protein
MAEAVSHSRWNDAEDVVATAETPKGCRMRNLPPSGTNSGQSRRRSIGVLAVGCFVRARKATSLNSSNKCSIRASTHSRMVGRKPPP